MNKYHTIRYLDSDSNILGYRSDSLGSINTSWGKVYNAAHDSCINVFNRMKDKVREELTHHQSLARVISVLFPNNDELLSQAISVELIEVDGFDGYSNSSYSNDDFARLIITAVVIDSFIIKE